MEYGKTIKIRDLKPQTVERVKQLAKQKKLSMNAFLRNLLDNLAGFDEFKKYEQGYIELVEKNLLVIGHCTEQLKRISDLISDDEK